MQKFVFLSGIIRVQKDKYIFFYNYFRRRTSLSAFNIFNIKNLVKYQQKTKAWFRLTIKYNNRQSSIECIFFNFDFIIGQFRYILALIVLQNVDQNWRLKAQDKFMSVVIYTSAIRQQCLIIKHSYCQNTMFEVFYNYCNSN